MKFGIALGALNPKAFDAAVLEAERLGYESAWLPEHLVFPMEIHGSPIPGEEHPPVPPSTPVFDAFAMLAYYAGMTRRIRLGTNVYLLGLRHPFIAARAIQTLDHVSNGRAEVGVGAGWLRAEWRAAGLDPATRGRRLDECIDVCKRLWTEPEIAHQGEFHAFDRVAFEPKPIQKPHPPLHIGGESAAAFARAGRVGDGWIGFAHDPDSVRGPLALLDAARRESGRHEAPFEVTIMSNACDAETLARFAELGVTRLIATPWKNSREAVEAIRRHADAVGLG